MRARYYDEFSGWHHRAAQAWQILITAARTRSVMSYEDLSDAMNFSRARFMSHVLSRIDRVCEEYGVPKLNDLVVNDDDTPGHRSEDPREAILEERRRVFDFDWYALVPPTSEEYSAATSKGVEG